MQSNEIYEKMNRALSSFIMTSHCKSTNLGLDHVLSSWCANHARISSNGFLFLSEALALLNLYSHCTLSLLILG